MTEPTIQETSPLAEAIPTSIEDLFNIDPLKLTQKNLEDTVAYLRHARETFLRDESAKPKKVAGLKAPAKTALDTKLTVDDLDI